MTGTGGDGVGLAAWLDRVGVSLEPEEAVLFLDSARVLLPPELGLEATLQAGAAPTPAQRDALRALWLRTGAPPSAPCPMPLHPLTPNLFGASWRRVREVLSHSPRPEAE